MDGRNGKRAIRAEERDGEREGQNSQEGESGEEIRRLGGHLVRGSGLLRVWGRLSRGSVWLCWGWVSFGGG